MFKKPTKKQFIIRRVALSTIATFSVITIATVSILFMLGYRLDSGNGRLEQGALLQFDSKPNNADIYVDGYHIGSRTAAKHTVIAGPHTIKITKQGYQDWSRSLDLAAGTLTWLDYIRLVPNDLPVQTVATYTTLASAKASPDNKWILIQEDAKTPVFQLVDLRAREIKQSTVTLPETVYSEATTARVTHSFSPVSWDTGGRHVLIRHLYAGKTEWLALDTQNASQAVNITRLFNTGFKDVRFASTSGRVLYGLTQDGTIRKIDLSAQTLSRALITHAESFGVFDNTVVYYVGADPTDASGQVAGVYRDGDDAPHVLQTSVEAGSSMLRIAAGRYYNDDLVAIADGNLVTVLRGRYPSSSTQDSSSLQRYHTFEVPGAVSSLTISPEGDFILAQSGDRFVGYEVEHKRATSGVRATSTNGTSTTTLQWLDDAYVWDDAGGVLTMRDFNGANVYEIMPVEPGFDAGLSQNGRFFYAIGKGESRYHLQRVTMILD